MLSGVVVAGVDYDDTGDMKYVLQHLKDYKYDENKDLNANMAAALKNRCETSLWSEFVAAN